MDEKELLIAIDPTKRPSYGLSNIFMKPRTFGKRVSMDMAGKELSFKEFLSRS